MPNPPAPSVPSETPEQQAVGEALFVEARRRLVKLRELGVPTPHVELYLDGSGKWFLGLQADADAGKYDHMSDETIEAIYRVMGTNRRCGLEPDRIAFTFCGALAQPAASE